MNSPRLAPRIAWPLAVVAAIAALALSVTVLALPLWLGGLIAVLVFVALYLILDPRSTKEVATDAYTAQARAQAQRTVEKVMALTKQVQEMPYNPVLPHMQEITRLTSALLNEVQEKRPNELLSAAQAVDYRVDKLGEALNVYGDMLRDYRESARAQAKDVGERLANTTLPSLEQWLNNNLDRLHAGDMMQLEATMNQLEASKYEALK